MVKLKICGITNLNDALFCSDNGADALGFVLYEKSPRNVSIKKSTDIIKHLPPFISTVAVCVNPSNRLVKIVEDAGFSVIQIHGNNIVETRIKKIRAVSYKMISECPLNEYVLIDSAAIGGTGKSFNWKLLKTLTPGKIIVSGGLNKQNIFSLFKIVKPYAVDLSSSLESSPGIKNHSKIKEFIAAFQEADREIL